VGRCNTRKGSVAEGWEFLLRRTFLTLRLVHVTRNKSTVIWGPKWGMLFLRLRGETEEGWGQGVWPEVEWFPSGKKEIKEGGGGVRGRGEKKER